MRRIVPLFFALLFVAFGLVGCSKYTSHYNAVAHVHSNDSDSARTSFIELDGTEVFQFKCDSGKEARIQYSGKLEDGSLTVYIDCGEAKTELFSVRAGEEISASSDPFTADTVYIIMETSGKCQNGAFGFAINDD